VLKDNITLILRIMYENFIKKGAGSGIRDPGSAIQKKFIPDPGSRG
jgi:hypothetical protein